MIRLLFLATLAFPMAAQPPSELNFAGGIGDFRDLRNMLPNYVHRDAIRLLDERRRAVERITSRKDVMARRTYLREQMTAALGGFPERTPLNARTVAVLDRGDYKIEKVIFESQPKFFVTANLYLPKTGRPPYPAVLYPLGHEEGAKAHGTWQQMLGSLAMKGYVALAWDPIGQGERVQLYDADLEESKAVRSTTEHTIIGIQCLLTGQNLARYTIWDGMRALDYLLSRPEVDAQRVACTGNSGGGTHTAYLSALDDRIQVAAPSCYLTSWRRLLETIGPQDAEQNIPPWLAAGLDHPDFIYAFGGKPYIVLSAIRDFFSIAGARETYQEARRIYGVLDASEKLAMTEADDGHGYTKPRRMAAYRWFAKWLKGAEDNDPEPEVRIATEDELYCTPTGQVATSLGGETVHSMNLRRAEQLKRSRPTGNLRAAVERRIAWRGSQSPLNVRAFGDIRRPGYRIEKIVFESEPGIVIPSLLFLPEGGAAKKPAIVWANGRGKAADGAPGGDVESLVEGGAIVLAIDARGFGESQSAMLNKGNDWPRFFGDFDSAMTALLTGRTLVAMRALDITRAVDLLAARPEVDARRISAVGKGIAAVPLLHAAFLDSRMARTGLEGMIVSYQSVVASRMHRGVFENVVRGVLESYDLSDLAAALGPRSPLIVDAIDAMGSRAPLDSVRREYSGLDQGRIVRREVNQSAAAVYAELMR